MCNTRHCTTYIYICRLLFDILTHGKKKNKIMKEKEITLQAINIASNRNRRESESTKKIAEIVKKYANDIDKDINAELSSTIRLAKVKAIIAYVNAILGNRNAYTDAIAKALEDGNFATLCANTTDVTSVEWFIGRVFSGSISDVANVLKKVLGSQVKSLGKQIKRMANGIANSGMWQDTDFVGANKNVTESVIAQNYEKVFPEIVHDKGYFADACKIAFYLLHKGK